MDPSIAQPSAKRRRALRRLLRELETALASAAASVSDGATATAFGDFVARLPHGRARATHAAHRHSRRCRWAHEGLLVVFAIVGEFAEVKSLVMRELLQGGSVQLD